MTAAAQGDPTVSIIVPTFNRRERLARLLRALDDRYAAGARFEVVITVDGATDGTAEMLAGLTARFPLRVLHQPNSGPGAARNRAVRAATGDVLLFMDDDVVPVDGMIERHLAVHRADERAVVTGPMLAPPGTRMACWLEWEARTLQKQYDAMIAGRYEPTPRQFYTANASVRRRHVLAAGGFDERYSRAEDVEFAYRMRDHGLRFVFVPEAIVHHEPDRTLGSWLRVGYEYGRHDVIMSRTPGREFILATAYREWNERRAASRRLVRWCVGHPVRLCMVRAAGSAGLRVPGPAKWRRIQFGLCSILFSAQYWQGLADETQLGAGVWAGAAAARSASQAVHTEWSSST